MKNPFFETQGLSPGEKELLAELVEESIQRNGVDIVYLSRKYVATDEILNEVMTSKFEKAFTIEMYMDDVSSIYPNSLMMSKFGLQYASGTTNFTVSNRRFLEECEQFGIDEPEEGDIIYVPKFLQFFEIKDVNIKDPTFAELVYILECSPYQYSYEKFDKQSAQDNPVFEDLDGAKIIEEFLKGHDISDKIAATADSECVTVDDTIDNTTDEDHKDNTYPITTDREYETIDDENAFISDDYSDKPVGINKTNDGKYEYNRNAALEVEADKYKKDFGFS